MRSDAAVSGAGRPPSADGRARRRVVLALSPRRALPDVAGFEHVLVPNARAAQAMGLTGAVHSIERIAGKQLLSGTSSAPLAVASELRGRRLLRRAVRDVLDPEDLEGTVRRYGAAVREILRAGYGAAPETEALGAHAAIGAAVGAGDGGGPEATVSHRAGRVLALVSRYRALLRDEHLVDRAEMLWMAGRRVERPERVLVAGYPRVGLGELHFLDAFAGAGSVFLLPLGSDVAVRSSEDAAAYLAARAWAVERSPEPGAAVGERLAARLETGRGRGAPATPEEARALRFADQEDEVRWVLTEVKALLRSGADPQAVALIARDEALYGPLVRAVADEYRLPVKLSYAVGLRETRLGAWLGDLTESLRSELPFEPTARLLAHPLSRVLDADRWTAARERHPHGLSEWTALASELGTLDWPGRGTRSSYREQLDRTLAALGVRERLAAMARLSLDRRAERKLRAGLNELSAEPGVVRLDAFLAELDDLLAALTVPIDPPEVPGVALHSPLAVFGARFRHIFVLGMAEGLTPAPVRDDPLLDFFERSRLRGAGLALESAAEAAERERMSFWAALDTAERAVTLTYPELAGGGERVASPLFAALGLEPVAVGAKPPASLPEARAVWLRRRQEPGVPATSESGAVEPPEDDPVVLHALEAWRVERRRESGEPWDAHDGVVGVPLDAARWTFSASQITALGQCAFKWFAERRLQLGELEEAEEEVSPLVRGSIYHRALELALARARDAEDVRAAALEQLEAAFAEAEADVGIPRQASWPLRRRQHLEVLRRALRADDFFTPDGEIVSLEQGFDGTWRGLRVRGIVDRIDLGPGGLVMLDYKTRATRPVGAKSTSGKADLDVQLPLYVEAAAPALQPGEPVAGARYYSLTKAKVIGEATIDEEELAGLVERVRGHLEAGAYPVDPDLGREACRYCAFDLVCRMGPRIERKRQGGNDR